MNNHQAGAFRELIRREERARELWHASMTGPNGAIAGSATGNLPPVATQPAPAYYPPAGASATATARAPSMGQSYGGDSVLMSATSLSDGLPIDHTGIYERATRISSPRLVVDDVAQRGLPGEDQDEVVRKRVVRHVELPFNREVRVPVTSKQVVSTVVPRRVRTTRIVEVPSFRTVQEPYTQVEEHPAIRHREIWVKKVVPERYMKRVEVQKTRPVRVPTTELKEVADYAVVDVPTHTTVDVPGFRVDTVQDSKLVEVEEHQPFALRPVAAGQAEVVGARELGSLGTRGARTLGAHVYHPADDRIAHLEVDSAAPGLARSSVLPRPQSSATTRDLRQTGGPRATGSFSARGFASTGGQIASQAPSDARIGFAVRESDGKRSVEAGSGGVVVSNVTRGDAGERAGVRVGDLITHVNNRATRNQQEFTSVVNNSSGALLVRAKRRGGYTLSLTVHR